MADHSADAPRASADWPAAASMSMGRVEQRFLKNVFALFRRELPERRLVALCLSHTVVSGSTSRTGAKLLVAALWARRPAAGQASLDPLTRCEDRLRAPLFARQLQQAPFLGGSASGVAGSSVASSAASPSARRHSSRRFTSGRQRRTPWTAKRRSTRPLTLRWSRRAPLTRCQNLPRRPPR